MPAGTYKAERTGGRLAHEWTFLPGQSVCFPMNSVVINVP